MILREIKNMYIKNRLTEGVDFVRKEWLKGDGSAYINTNIKPSENLRTKTKAAYTSDSILSRNSAIFGSSLIKSGKVSNRYWVNYDVINFEIGYGGYLPTNYSINPDQDFEIDFNYIEDNAHKFKINNSVYTQSGEPNTTQNIVIFGRNVNGSVYVISCRVSYFQLINSSNLIMDLVPCQLLKSIPATLDANNIARSAGECGMYDSISGKFYGNVADSGSFTVEGDVEPETHSGLQQIYQNKLIEGVDYETYDWLKGDGTAYIDTLLKPSSSLETQIKFVFSYGLESIPRNTVVFGSCVKEPGWKYAYSRYWINYDNKFEIGYDYYVGTGYITESGLINEIDFNYIEDNVHKFRINNEVYTVSGSPNSTINMVLFGANIGGYNITTSKINISYCRFIKSNLTIAEFIPCQLIRSIPRNLDAQCKERNAGECGMIDLISGKFYGNVANGGTFTVENDN